MRYERNTKTKQRKDTNMGERINPRLSYLAVLIVSIALGSVIAAQTWASGAPGATDSGDAGRPPDSPLPLENPFKSVGEAETIQLEHLPVEVQTLEPARTVLDSNAIRLCGVGIGPYSLTRRYCDTEGDTAFLMSVGMSKEQMLAQDPTLKMSSDPIPEGIQVVTLADGSEAYFADTSVAADNEATETVGSGAVERMIRLNWRRAGDGIAVALDVEFAGKAPEKALNLDALVKIADSIYIGQPLIGVPLPHPYEIGKRAQEDLLALTAELQSAGLEVQIERSSEPGLIVNVEHELIGFGGQLWAIPGSTITIQLGD